MLHETYEPVIGLEVHCQLQTESKLFSPEAASYGAPPNTHVDPVSLGHPGTLPVLNTEAVTHTLRMGLATHCSIAERSFFARKHYFYPDLPKGYQTSQYDTPLCYGGYLEIETEEADKQSDNDLPTRKRIGITRIHLEEDAGKSIHDQDEAHTLLDYNRCGVPLIEMVSEPDLRSPREAYRYLQKVRQLVRWLGISNGNMEEGSLRCDANVSVRPKGQTRLGTRTELKNLNSIRNVERALEYEINRQIVAHEQGEAVQQHTLLWDADAERTRPLRSKEEAHDYRYMPDPDLPPVVVPAERVEALRANLPEMPDARCNRFVHSLGLPPYDAEVLTEERAVADYFEEALSSLFKRTKGGDTNAQAKEVANFVMSDVLRTLNETDYTPETLPVTPRRLAQLVYLRLEDKVSSSGAQKVFNLMLEHTDASAGKIADDHNLIQISDRSQLEPVAESVLDNHPDNVETYLNGKDGLLGFFIGQVMQRVDGSPNPQLVRNLLTEKLDERASNR
ncbi:MAG: Asp-tRNA(Asn)/Glu-tRNA(Gln) amidotransferase subunit GatB [Bacteroidota bacterium]